MTGQIRQNSDPRRAGMILAAAAVAATAVAAVTANAALDEKNEPAFRITRSEAKVAPGLVRAFAALEGGNLTAAESGYARVLKTEPNNADALHGAAVVALRGHRRPRAEALLRHAIAADPADAYAHSILAGLYAGTDAGNIESRLKTLIASQPDEHCLHFALGNAYAASERWREAQQAFLRAFRAAPDQPDYLFNLAISLDHLHQTTTARQLYERALRAAERFPAAFDKALAAARIAELTP